MAVHPGELWAVLGRNGSGKSTFLRTIARVLRPVSGTMHRRPGLRVSWVAQRTGIDTTVPARSIDVVRSGLDGRWSFTLPLRRPGRAVDAALDVAGATALARARFHELSEGQKQRVLLAQAIVSAPDLLLLDEPASAMDATSERHLFDVLDRVRAERSTGVVLVSHHVDLTVARSSHGVFVDADASAVAAGPIDEVSDSAAFRHRYALPSDEEACT
jgi:zinc transport system ATP-binding protein